ncbi:MAG: hypothetical protein DIZ80_00530 [endosymbiont of Galathealinum brachiosum]|uniref:Uncharacterized protein n=1 Tax=endosymbiont of Galathealinum brachiosum TaxID=2200906 RepID=A0A370DM55_9GAMM|nr:MAG: hypothetical protein DIZ80_00530 [endosymbiont of Galathealinum brachiosum]
MRNKIIFAVIVLIVTAVILISNTFFKHPDPFQDALLPSGEAIPLNAGMDSYVGSPDTIMNLGATNVDELLPDSGLKNIRPGELYVAKSVVNIKRLFENFAPIIEQRGETDRARAMRVIANSATDKYVFQRPAHQFRINGELDNRVLFYGADNELENGPGLTHINSLTHDIGLPVVKVMTKFNLAQGGDLLQILKSGGGAKHVGGFTSGWYKGNPVAILSDWPYDYGVLGDDNRYYNAHLLAIDYQAGTRKTIPDNVLQAYTDNYKLWDVFSGMVIPFALASNVKEYQDYSRNPLEVVDRESLNKLAEISATLDTSRIKFTSYCAEGIWNVGNLAVNHLIFRGRYPAIDKLIETFQAAPAYRDMQEGERRKQPQIGWNWLYNQGMITGDQHRSMMLTRRVATYLDWVPELPNWSEYEPYHAEGLIGEPFNLAQMVRMVLRTFYPREAVSKAIIDEVTQLYKTDDADLKQAIEIFLSGRSPDSLIGGKELATRALYMASGELVYALKSKEFKDLIFDRLGYEYIIELEDQERVDNMYEEYLEAIMDPELFDRDDLDVRMEELSKRISLLKVNMQVYGPDDTTKRTAEKVMPFFIWAPPQGWVFWAQHPQLYNSQAIRYIATAQHFEQSERYAEENAE